ncbi:hypothetical protein U1Q18_008456 [Sarracenia purpurea var. burkii]
MKSRIKALIAEEMSKRKGRHHRSCSYPTRMQLTRTDSIHHLEALKLNPPAKVGSNDSSQKIVHQETEKSSPASEESVTINQNCEFCADMVNVNSTENNPLGENGKQSVENEAIFQDNLNEDKQDLLAQRVINVKEPPNKDASFHHESKQFLDVLDIFTMSNELFQKILQDQSPTMEHYFHGRRAFNSKIGFTKSMSFPLSDKRSFVPSKLEEHEKMTESCAKAEKKTQVASDDQRSDTFPKPFVAKIDPFGSTSMGSIHVLKNRQENNRVVTKHFKNLKQKIKQAIKESRKERHRITMDAVLHKIPYGRKLSKDVMEEIVDFWKETSMGKCKKHKTRSCCENDGKGRPNRMRRTSSFDESMDRYRRLYESNYISERVILATEETPSPCKTDEKALGRMLSLPDLRAYYHLESDKRETSCLHVGSENEILFGCRENSVEIDDLNVVGKDEDGLRLVPNGEEDGQMDFSVEDLENLKTRENDAQNENKIQAIISLDAKLAEPSSVYVLDSSMTSPTKLYFSEALSSPEPTSLFSVSTESFNASTNHQQEASSDFPIPAETRVNLEKREAFIDQLNSEFFRVLVNSKDIAEFNYVKYVLQLSGFSRSDQLLGTWHSPDQPVNPSIFEELEGYSENDQEGDINCDHLLLFDLINEVLLEIYERSFTYWPMPLSSICHIRPAPVGFRVLEEVWSNVSLCLSWRPETDQSLDDAVTRDLAKRDGWMNLQFEGECVGLELEEMIFDDLLEELIV